MSTLPLSVIIPTYNGLALLQRNLPSVLAGLRSHDEVIIVDDASSDQTVTWLRETYHLELVPTKGEFEQWRGKITKPHTLQFSLVRNQHNLRFGASCNRGVKLASSKLVLLLNNDVSLHLDTVQHLLPHFEDPLVFAVGCHEQETYHGRISGGKNKIWFERGLFYHQRADDFSTGETAWASGGSALFDRQKWLELGGFDPLYYPAYWEDVDLSFRARRRGWKVLFEAKAVVDHNHESTNNDVFGQQRITQMSIKNARAFTWRHGSWSQKISFLMWLPWYWLRQRV